MSLPDALHVEIAAPDVSSDAGLIVHADGDQLGRA